MDGLTPDGMRIKSQSVRTVTPKFGARDRHQIELVTSGRPTFFTSLFSPKTLSSMCYGATFHPPKTFTFVVTDSLSTQPILILVWYHLLIQFFIDLRVVKP
jgi:hypothetical protein